MIETSNNIKQLQDNFENRILEGFMTLSCESITEDRSTKGLKDKRSTCQKYKAQNGEGQKVENLFSKEGEFLWTIVILSSCVSIFCL